MFDGCRSPWSIGVSWRLGLERGLSSGKSGVGVLSTKTPMGVAEEGKHPLGLDWDGCAGVQNTFHSDSNPSCTVPPCKVPASLSSAPHPAPSPPQCLGVSARRGAAQGELHSSLNPEGRAQGWREEPGSISEGYHQPTSSPSFQRGVEREGTWSSWPGCHCHPPPPPPPPLLCSLFNHGRSPGAPQPPCPSPAFLLLPLPTSCGQGMRAQGTHLPGTAAHVPTGRLGCWGPAGVARGQAFRNVVFSIPVSVKVVNQRCKKGFCFRQHAAGCCACQPWPRLQEPGRGHRCTRSQVSLLSEQPSLLMPGEAITSIPLSLCPFPGHSPSERASFSASCTAQLCPCCCHPLLAVSTSGWHR